MVSARAFAMVTLITVLLVFTLQSLMWVLGAVNAAHASLIQRANHCMYVFQTTPYTRSNTANFSLKPSGRGERALIILIMLSLIAIIAVSVAYFAMGERELPYTALNCVFIAYGATCLAAVLLFYVAAARKIQQKLFMRTLFNNALYNSLSNDPTFSGALSLSGPTRALQALGVAYAAAAAAAAAVEATGGEAAPPSVEAAPPTEAATTLSKAFLSEKAASAAVSQGVEQTRALGASVRAGASSVMSRVSASVWARLGPGFARFYTRLRDFAADVHRESVLLPLGADDPIDGWVSALITVNLYLHVSRNVPRDTPLFPTVMAVFSNDDYTRRGVDYFSFFMYGEYNVIDNRASLYRTALPDAIREVVLRRVQQRMGIINGLAEKATGGTVEASDIYTRFTWSMLGATSLPLLGAYLMLLRLRALLMEDPHATLLATLGRLFELVTTKA